MPRGPRDARPAAHYSRMRAGAAHEEKHRNGRPRFWKKAGGPTSPGAPRGASPRAEQWIDARPPSLSIRGREQSQPPAHLRRRPWPNVRLGRLGVDG